MYVVSDSGSWADRNETPASYPSSTTPGPDAASQNASRQATTGSPTGSTNRSDRTVPANPAYPVPTDATATGSTSPKQ